MAGTDSLPARSVVCTEKLCGPERAPPADAGSSSRAPARRRGCTGTSRLRLGRAEHDLRLGRVALAGGRRAEDHSAPACPPSSAARRRPGLRAVGVVAHREHALALGQPAQLDRRGARRERPAVERALEAPRRRVRAHERELEPRARAPDDPRRPRADHRRTGIRSTCSQSKTRSRAPPRSRGRSPARTTPARAMPLTVVIVSSPPPPSICGWRTGTAPSASPLSVSGPGEP